MGACPGVQLVQYWNRGDNWVQRAVQISERAADGKRFGTQRGTGKDPENSEMVVQG